VSGYKGSFKKKTGNKTDGCAIYYRLRKLFLVEAREVEYYRAGVPQLNRDNVGLALRLALVSAPSVQLTVATTHLLFTPRRWDVREAQIQVLLDHIHDMSR
jgi:protein angel